MENSFKILKLISIKQILVKVFPISPITYLILSIPSFY